MNVSSKNALVGLCALACTAFVVVACGSSDDSEFGDQGPALADFEDSGAKIGDPDVQPDAGDIYANDPPPQWCGPAGEPEPPKPGGTQECPDDKNKPGCACKTAGETAACWTGLRANRGLGVCKDGQTTCKQQGETGLVWGECVGEVLPTSGATKGPDACQCFSAGQWKIANLVPCYYEFTDNTVQSFWAVSSKIESGTGNAVCPAASPKPAAAPSEDWSTSTLKADCAGTFHICYRIKVGDAANPTASDCTVGEACTDGDYTTPGVEQPWPNLKGWLGKDDACAQKWYEIMEQHPEQSPGYGEMVVKGKSVRCDVIDDGAGNDFVFNRLQYCPKKCQTDTTDPVCAECGQKGQGEF